MLERTAALIDRVISYERIFSLPVRFVRVLGEMMMMLFQALLWGVGPRFVWAWSFQQMEFIGVGSLSDHRARQRCSPAACSGCRASRPSAFSRPTPTWAPPYR
jgi:hypothetical protein